MSITSKQQVDARLVIDAGVEEDVPHHVLRERRALQHVGQAAVAAPVVRAPRRRRAG